MTLSTAVKSENSCIHTILGEIPVEKVDMGLCHEHTIIHIKSPSRIAPRYHKEIIRKARQIVLSNWKALIKRGCNTIVDATVSNRKYPEFHREMSLVTGMNVVMATGHYSESNMSTQIKKLSIDELASLMHKELKTGVYNTKIRAGIIKVTSGSWELQKNEQKAFRAASTVSRKTDAPITTHSYPGLANHAKFFIKAKVNPERVAFGHADACTWIDNMQALKSGFLLVFTNIGGDVVLPEDIIAAKIAHFVRRGFVKQILVGSDHCLFVKKDKLVPYFPHPPNYVFDNFVPRLIQSGVKPSQIDQIFTENVRQYLKF